MKYFVSKVTTYSVQGKTKRGALLQKVAQEFENVLLPSDLELKLLVKKFADLVAALNETSKGKPLKLDADLYKGWIIVKPASPYNDNFVFDMTVRRVKEGFMNRSQVSYTFYSLIEDQTVRDLMKQEKGGAV